MWVICTTAASEPGGTFAKSAEDFSDVTLRECGGLRQFNVGR
jgi:hypothetical protein